MTGYSTSSVIMVSLPVSFMSLPVGKVFGKTPTGLSITIGVKNKISTNCGFGVVGLISSDFLDQTCDKRLLITSVLDGQMNQ